eukprot:2500547-Lingulodinium_polyedra.AAC.1
MPRPLGSAAASARSASTPMSWLRFSTPVRSPPCRARRHSDMASLASARLTMLALTVPSVPVPCA